MLTATNRSNIKISKEIELKRFSEKTSKFIKKFKTIFLYGELGVGKTTFVKYLINNLQKHEKTKRLKRYGNGLVTVACSSSL